MSMDRRKFQLLVGSLGVSSLAGCINVPETGGGGGGGDGSSSTNTTNETTDDNGEEEEEPTLTPELKVYNSIDGVYSFSKWVGNNMAENRSQIRSVLSDVSDRLGRISSGFDNEDLSESYIQDTASELRNAGEIVVEMTEYYGSLFSYNSYADEIEETLINSLQRSEYEDLREQASDYENVLSDHLKLSYFIENYPMYFVSREPYLTFSNVSHQYDSDSEVGVVERINDIEWRNIYEVYYRGGSVDHGMYVIPGVMNIPYYPFGVSPNESSNTQELFNPDNLGDVRDREIDLIDNSMWLSVEDGRSGELFMNIHPYRLLDDRYPEDGYMLRSSDDLKYRRELRKPNLNDSDPIGIYIQKYASEEAAVAAVESIKETVQVDGERTLFDTPEDDEEDWEENKIPITFEQLFNVPSEGDDRSETLYADVYQNGEYVVAFDVQSEQWSTRELLDKTTGDEEDEEYESVSVERVLYQSWLNVHQITEE